LSSKQNEMYQIAQREGFSTTNKNASIGLWYDARSKIQSLMGELKNIVANK